VQHRQHLVVVNTVAIALNSLHIGKKEVEILQRTPIAALTSQLSARVIASSAQAVVGSDAQRMSAACDDRSGPGQDARRDGRVCARDVCEETASVAADSTQLPDIVQTP